MAVPFFMKKLTKKEKLVNAIIGAIVEEEYYYYLDRDDNFDFLFDKRRFREFQEELEEHPEDIEGTFLYEFLYDYYIQSLDYWVEEFEDKFKKMVKEGIFSEEFYENFMEENEDNIRETIMNRVKNDLVDACIDNTSSINISVVLYSNYDCTNSFWFESESGFRAKESYLETVFNAVSINPAEVKKIFKADGYKTFGPWKNKKKAKNVITPEDFYAEYRELSCPASLFCFLGRISFRDYIDLYRNKEKKIIIPKGNPFGFYSYSQGGGSLFEYTIKEDFLIDLNKHYPGNYDKFEIEVDESFGDYGIGSCYGTCDEFFGDEIKLSICDKVGKK